MQADTVTDPSGFRLDSRLEGDTRLVIDLPLCRLLLMDDARWPWTILVPRRPGLTELFDLAPADRAVLVEETARVAALLKPITGAEKINVGALGNSVRQLHVHVLARVAGDPNWPGPVWGFGTRQPYADAKAEALRRRILEGLA